MSCRWKKKQPALRDLNWLSMGDFDPEEHGAMFQSSRCSVTGEVFVRPFTGCFKNMPEEKLVRLVAEMKRLLTAAGIEPNSDPDQPLWLTAEYLRNALDFERHPPCGCASRKL